MISIEELTYKILDWSNDGKKSSTCLSLSEWHPLFNNCDDILRMKDLMTS